MKLKRITTNLVIILLLLLNGCGNNQEANTSLGQKDAIIYYDLDIYELEKLANVGDVEAQRTLGFKYYYGEETIQDYQKAFEWYSKAAEQGDNSAQDSLGDMYYKGQSVQQDYQKAFEWYSNAAEKGDPSYQFKLGRMYYNGEGVSQDSQKAIELYTKAAEKGGASYQRKLGRMYREGEDITQDYQEAIKWLTKATEQGDDIAQLELGLVYEKQQDYQKAIECYSKVIEQGGDAADAAKMSLKQVNFELEFEAIQKSDKSITNKTISATNPKSSLDLTTLDLDKCIQGVKDELTNSDDRILDIDITVDATKEQINFSVVVDDTTAPEASLDIGDTVIKRLNNYARGQDTTVKPHDTNYYGGLYDTYAIVIGVSPLSEVSNIDNWYVYDYIEQDVQGYVPLKLQEPYR